MKRGDWFGILLALFAGLVFGWTFSESTHSNCPSEAAADTASNADDNEDRFVFTSFVQLEDPESPVTSGRIRMMYDRVDKTCTYYYLKGAHTSFGLGQASCPKSYQQQPSANNVDAPAASQSSALDDDPGFLVWCDSIYHRNVGCPKHGKVEVPMEYLAQDEAEHFAWCERIEQRDVSCPGRQNPD